MATRSSYLAGNYFSEGPFFNSSGNNRAPMPPASPMANSHPGSNGVAGPYRRPDPSYMQRQHSMTMKSVPEFSKAPSIELDENAANFEEEANHVHNWFRELKSPEKTATLCTLLKGLNDSRSRELSKELEKKLAPAWPVDVEHEMLPHLDRTRHGQDDFWFKNSRHSYALGDNGVDSNLPFQSLLGVPSTTSGHRENRPRSWYDDSDDLASGVERMHIGTEAHRRNNLDTVFAPLRESDEQEDRLSRTLLSTTPRSPLLASPQPQHLAGKQRFQQTLPPPPSSSVSSHAVWGFHHDPADAHPPMLPDRGNTPQHYSSKANHISTTAVIVSAAAAAAAATPVSISSTSNALLKDRKQTTDVNKVDMKLLEDVPAWLRSLRLHKYNPIFEFKKWQELVQLTDNDLLAKGVSAQGARTKFLKVFEEVKKHCDQNNIPYC